MAKGYNEQELTAFAVGRSDIEQHIKTLERRLGEEQFAHKHGDYRLKLEQLEELSGISKRLREMGRGD